MTVAVSPEGEISAEGFELAQQLLRDAANGKFRAGALPDVAPQQVVESPRRSSIELAKLAIAEHKEWKSCVVRNEPEQAARHLTEYRRLDRELVDVQQAEKETEAARASYLASTAFAAAQEREAAEMARQRAENEARAAFIRDNIEAIGNLHIALDAAYAAIGIRETQGTTSPPPPQFLTREIQNEVRFGVGAYFMAHRIPGKHASASFHGVVLREATRAFMTAQDAASSYPV